MIQINPANVPRPQAKSPAFPTMPSNMPLGGSGLPVNSPCSRYPYRASKRSMERSMSPLTARAAAAPIGPNNGLPPRSRRKVNSHPDAVGETVIRSAYLVPPTPLPVISSRRGGSTSATVHVTRFRRPLAPATPTRVAPAVSSAGTSPRHPWCITNQSPRSARLDACAQASCAVIDSPRDSSSFAMVPTRSISDTRATAFRSGIRRAADRRRHSH